MKKHLIAAAVAAAVAAPAMAQVSLYGNADIRVVRTDTDGGLTTTSIASRSGWSSPVFGARGTEDLGGGLKAEFQLEGNMNFGNGELGGTGVGTGSAANNNTVNSAARTFDREAWVGVSGSFGAVRIGRTDVSASQGVDGVISVAGNLSDFSTEIGSDQDNVIRYTSPSINGFTVDIGQSNTASATAKGTTDILGYSVRYAKGPLDLRAGRMEGEKTPAGTKDDEMTAFGGSYNLGFATVGVARNKLKSADAALDHKEVGFSISVPLANGYGLVAAHIDQDFAAAARSDKTQTVIGASKALSKRTGLYAVYLDTDYDGGTGATRLNDKSEMMIGLRHSF